MNFFELYEGAAGFFERLRQRLFGGHQVVVTQPIVINPTYDEKAKIAFYRLDAIRRYLEQTEDVAEAKMREFVLEARAHVGFLHSSGLVSDDERLRLLKSVKAEG